ncbi:spermatogenesis-associated protein 9 isoform X2 [Ovis aries]|uniref:spermatogenesis-associated protein 9 isoform X2 n=1 Tax=Ovis aries TaxID=9940 RepID=UPI00295261C4|nr:spermatogenesis-associated protein 9 isoform X2 [Ovis aries]
MPSSRGSSQLRDRIHISLSQPSLAVEGIQKVIMDLIDEFKDEFPTILRLSQSNQKREPMQKPSKIRMAIALAKINRGTLIQGLNTISRSSKSVAKLLQPQLACRLLELRAISHRLLKEVNAPRQPLYNVQVRKGSLFEIISFPAKTALTSIMCVSYAALIYLRNKLKTRNQVHVTHCCHWILRKKCFCDWSHKPGSWFLPAGDDQYPGIYNTAWARGNQRMMAITNWHGKSRVN